VASVLARCGTPTKWRGQLHAASPKKNTPATFATAGALSEQLRVRDYDPEYTAPAEWTLLLIEFTPVFCAHDPTVYVPAGTLPEPFAAP
jgi:hypothetical protein